MAEVGFLPPDDPRLVSTVDAIARELTTGGLVRRYQLSADGQSAVDGLPGSEGAFLACSFWLADALQRSAATTRPSSCSSGSWGCATTSAC